MSLNSTTKIETNRVELEIAVGQEQFAKAVTVAYRKNIGKMTVPGFRKGKAPRSVVERLYGEGVFYEDAVNELYPEAYEEAVKEAGIEPVDRADVEIVSVGKEGFTFKAKVTVKPEVEVGEYRGLKAEKVLKTVTEEDIDHEIGHVRERNARSITVEDRPAQNGDTVVIDFDGSVDGVHFDGGKAENYNLELGSGQFIPGFEEQVVGHSTDEEFDVNVTFPEDYGAKELAGKAAVFAIKLHEIKSRELPELDDEFAKDVSDFDTLDAYKEDVKKHLQEHFDEHAQEDVENALIDQVVAGMKAEIPEVMYERSIDNFVNDFDYRLQSQGLNLETYLQYTGMDMSSFRKTFREQAERQVKIRLALEKIAQIEKFEATAEDIDAEFKKLAERYGVEVDKIRNAASEDEIKKDVVVNKAVDLIRDTMVITEVAEAEKPAETAETAEAPETTEKEEAPAKKTRKSTKKAESAEK